MPFPILQFGTSRFLQAHFDAFVARGFVEGSGAGRIAVVQTTASADSARRVAFFDAGRPYRIHVRGLVDGAVVDAWEEVDSIGRGVDANLDWPATQKLFLNARWIVSNTGDRGYELDPADRPDNGIPRSFPAKLTKLLYARFAASRLAPVLFPCELIEGNGDRLKALTLELAASWGLSHAFRWSTASSPRRWSRRARSPSPIRCGRSRTGPVSSCRAAIRASSSPTISNATSG